MPQRKRHMPAAAGGMCPVCAQRPPPLADSPTPAHPFVAPHPPPPPPPQPPPLPPLQMGDTLFNIVKTPWKVNPNNSVVAFSDNSSAIRGFQVGPMHVMHS